MLIRQRSRKNRVTVASVRSAWLNIQIKAPTRDRAFNVCPTPQRDVPSGETDKYQPRMVLPDRIELSTSPLPMECSTTELRQHDPGGARIGREAPDRWGVLCHKPPCRASAGLGHVQSWAVKKRRTRGRGASILSIRSVAARSGAGEASRPAAAIPYLPGRDRRPMCLRPALLPRVPGAKGGRISQ